MIFSSEGAEAFDVLCTASSSHLQKTARGATDAAAATVAALPKNALLEFTFFIVYFQLFNIIKFFIKGISESAGL